jgi:hypothetical protein
MSSPPGATGSDAPAPALTDEITRSLSAIWNRHSSTRASDVSTVIEGDVVRCTFTDAVASFAAGPAPAEDEGATEEKQLPTYRHEATGAIARLTKRKVVAFIPRHDKKTDVAIETFILEERRRRN